MGIKNKKGKRRKRRWHQLNPRAQIISYQTKQSPKESEFTILRVIRCELKTFLIAIAKSNSSLANNSLM
jgi:hypothetical protein